MLIPQQAGKSHRRHGRRPADLAELRSQLAKPSINDDTRQRLLELARRLARVQALGDEYTRVDFSPHAAAALKDCLAVS